MADYRVSCRLHCTPVSMTSSPPVQYVPKTGHRITFCTRVINTSINHRERKSFYREEKSSIYPLHNRKLFKCYYVEHYYRNVIKTLYGYLFTFGGSSCWNILIPTNNNNNNVCVDVYGIIMLIMKYTFLLQASLPMLSIRRFMCKSWAGLIPENHENSEQTLVSYLCTNLRV